MKFKINVIDLEKEVKPVITPEFLDNVEMLQSLLEYCSDHRFMVSFVPIEDLPDED